MDERHAIYRTLLRLYPREFRDRYRDDLLQNFADLVRDRGRRGAWPRSVVDLIVTIPRYRLETIMNERNSGTAISVIVAVLAICGLFSVPMGFPLGALLVPIAAVLGITQRGALARALRPANSNRRRRRLGIAGLLAIGCIVATTIFILDVRGEEHWGGKVVVYNLIFFATLIGALVFFVTGLLTPKSERELRV